MIQLFYSNHFSILERRLSEIIVETQSQGDFNPVYVVVPSTWVEELLHLHLSQHLGVVMNLRFSRMELFWKTLFENHFRNGNEGLLLTQSVLEHLIYDTLLNMTEEERSSSVFEEVFAYLHPADSQDTSLHPQRMVSFSKKLGHLFETYALYRPSIVKQLSKGAAKSNGLQTWQRFIFDRCKHPRESGPHFTWLDLHERIGSRKNPENNLPAPVVFFGFSHMSPTHIALMNLLSEHVPVHCLSPNPCEAFWEDLDSKNKTSEDPVLLRIGSRLARDTIDTLNQMAEFSFDSVFKDPISGADPTSLQQLQSSVQHRTPAQGLPWDGSIVCIEGKGVFHECKQHVDAIVERIHRHQADPKSIAVLIHQGVRSVYLPVLKALMAEQRLPYSVIDDSFVGQSQVADAALKLLSLPLSKFHRQDLKYIFEHPILGQPVFASLQMIPVDVLFDQLGVFFGKSLADLEGTYIKDNVFNWDQAIARVVLGHFEMNTNGTVPKHHFGLLPHTFFGPKDDVSLHVFMFVRSLISEAQRLMSLKLSWSEWSKTIQHYFKQYITPLSHSLSFEEQKHLELLLSICRRLSLFDSTQDQESTPITYSLVMERIKSDIESEKMTFGKPLLSGVLLAPLHALHGLPFKHLFLPGLSEGLFPAQENADTLDLREKKDKSDVSYRDRDLYAFLESFLCAESSITLGYVSLDDTSGEHTLPSSPLMEVMNIMHPDKPVSALKTPHAEHQPPSTSSPWTLGALHSLATDFPSSHFSTTVFPTLSHLHSIQKNTSLHVSHHAVSVYQLKRFLDCPLQGWAHRLLNPPFSSVNTELHEPFFAKGQVRNQLLQHVFFEHLLSMKPMKEIYNRESNLYAQKGQWPVGVLGDLQWIQDERLLQEWKRVWSMHLHQAPHVHLKPSLLRLGGDRLDGLYHSLVPPSVSVGTHNIRIEGRLFPKLFYEHSEASDVFVFSSKAYDGTEASQLHMMRSVFHVFLEHLLHTVMLDKALEQTLVFIHPLDQRVIRKTLRKVSPDDARLWLSHLISDLLCLDLEGPKHWAIFFPCEAPFLAYRHRLENLEPGSFSFSDMGHDDLIKAAEKVRDQLGGGQSAFGPIERALEYSLPENPLEIVSRRMELLFKTCPDL